MRFLAFPLDSRPWCNGSTADSKPVSQGSNPWGRALRIDNLKKSCGPTATTPVLQTGNDGSIPSGTTSTMRRPDTPIGRATRLKPECLQVRSLLWVLKNFRKRRTSNNWATSSNTKHMGRSSNGKTSVLQAEDRGSIPRCSTHCDYGSVGNWQTTLA